MRIAVVAAPNQGKTRFISDFLKTWTNYKLSESTDKIYINDIKTFEKELLEKSFNNTIDKMCNYSKGSNVIHDTCVLDELVRMLWLSNQSDSPIDDKFIEKCIKLTHVSLTFLDIVVFIPKLEKYTVKIEGEADESDLKYADEINNLFLAIQDTYNKCSNTIFPFESVDGAPAMIEIFGRPEERIQMMKLYLDKDGDVFGKNPKDSLITLPNIEDQAYIDKLIDQTSTKPRNPKKLKK